MNNEELNEFLDALSNDATPEVLEGIVKAKAFISDLNTELDNVRANVNELNTSLTAQTALTRKYESLVKDYVKATPVVTEPQIVLETKSDYEDFLSED
jgi:ABC-type transporter Mla subunit MlaD